MQLKRQLLIYDTSEWQTAWNSANNTGKTLSENKQQIKDDTKLKTLVEKPPVDPRPWYKKMAG